MKVVHFDVPADNPERAKEFYKKVFGWNVSPVPNMNYWMLQTTECDKNNMPKDPGAINGGMYKKDRPEDRAPVVVINVPSVDQYVKKVEKAGGKVVMPKTEVGQMGFYARILDTEGNIWGIWENKPMPKQ